MAHGGRTGADERLAAELAAGKTVREAAATAGVSERTAFRRLDDPAFTARLVELRAATVRAAAGRLVDGMTEAADVLRAGLTHSDARVRFKYAVKVLELGVKACELTELVERVTQLERQLAGSAPAYRGPPPNQTVDDVK